MTVGDLQNRLKFLIKNKYVTNTDKCVLLSSDDPILINNVIVPKVKVCKYSNIVNAHIGFIEG